MKLIFHLLFTILLLSSCQKETTISSTNDVNWEKRFAQVPLKDSLVSGTSYLSVYSQIYSQNDQKTHDLTVTVSMRNTNVKDTIYINKATYFNTNGDAIRKYFQQPIFIPPMATVEIIIDERDQEGGTGANFLFDWSVDKSSNEPLFEAIMISTSNQQGLSFTTQGIKVD